MKTSTSGEQYTLKNACPWGRPSTIKKNGAVVHWESSIEQCYDMFEGSFGVISLMNSAFLLSITRLFVWIFQRVALYGLS